MRRTGGVRGSAGAASPALAMALALALALAIAAAPAEARPAYEWPLQPRPAIARGYDPPPRPWLSGHRGVDLAAAPDAAVLAARAGTVVFAGVVVDRPVVSVTHPDGVTTTYEPLTPAVRRGEHVRTGQVIGYLRAGHPGCNARACLHWGARTGSGRTARYRNPLGLLGLLRVRLKPVPLDHARGWAWE
ncbi:M23 family metallopeptidase [Gordonia sp. (in: high G+C Gram-positive bacteria)]|uniref:M23 family metallopeptidase n=1 Tax=Gordonia sp. (in: high G+C Gram-positive bacteria) TaxID=84139 RepID=UPI003C76FAD3